MRHHFRSAHSDVSAYLNEILYAESLHAPKRRPTMLASKAGARTAVTAPAGGFGAAFSNCLVLLANSPVKAFVRRRRNMTFAPLSGVSADDFTGNTAGPAAETTAALEAS